MNDAQERPSDFLHDLGDAVRKNPLSAALIGMGAVWLFSSRGGQASDTARDAWQASTSAWRSGAQGLKEGIEATSASVREQGSQAIDRLSGASSKLAQTASDYAGAAPEFADNLLGDMRANLGELFQAQPLALGAIGLAIGAAVAASLPTSDLEETYLGESSDLVMQKVSEIVGEQTQRAVEVGMNVIDAVADEAQQQGLTIDGLKTTARDLSGKVSRVADAAKNASADSASNTSNPASEIRPVGKTSG